MIVFLASFVNIVSAKLGQADAGDNEAKLMTKLAPEWVRTSDPVIRIPARYRWTMAPALKIIGHVEVIGVSSMNVLDVFNSKRIHYYYSENIMNHAFLSHNQHNRAHRGSYHNVPGKLT